MLRQAFGVLMYMITSRPVIVRDWSYLLSSKVYAGINQGLGMAGDRQEGPGGTTRQREQG